MSKQLQSKVPKIVPEKIELLTVIKNEPPESDIVEISIDSSYEESIPDIKNSDEISSEIEDIEIVLHELSADVIKSETVSENILENNHTESVKTQIFVKTENNPFIKTENITQSENLNETENTSDGNLNRGTGQGLIKGSNEHFSARNKNNGTHKQIKKRYCCEKCTYTCGKSYIKLHQLTHKTKAEIDDRLFKYRCDKCKYKTYWYNSFTAHKLTHLKPEEIHYFYCYHCSYKSKYKNNLSTHIFRHFKNEDVPFHCYVCDFRTLKRNLIIEHFKKHPKHHSKCDETDYKKQFEIYTKKQISCKICAFRTDHYEKLKRHTLTHKIEAGMDDRDFKYCCDKCKYKTFRHQDFKVHKLSHLKPEEIHYFYCYHCCYKSNLKINLQTHIFRHFKNEEVPFHCYVCDFRTLKRNLIIEHFKKHPKYHSKCDVTDYKNQLGTNTKKFRYCKKCLYKTYRYERLKLHELTHKTEANMDDRHFTFRCDKCNYKTFRPPAFKMHKLIHLKPEEIQYFYCYHCSYKSKHKSSLQRHILSHFKNEDVPFHCYICDFVTLKRVLIIEHFKTHPRHHSKYDETEYKY